MIAATFVWVGLLVWAARCSSLAVTVSHETTSRFVTAAAAAAAQRGDISRNNNNNNIRYRSVTPTVPVAFHSEQSSRIRRRLSPSRNAFVSLKLAATDDIDDAIPTMNTGSDVSTTTTPPRTRGGSAAAAVTTGGTLGWSNRFRQTMAFIAGLGMIETVYLTYADVTRSTSSLLCLAASSSSSSSCQSVLQGPYAHLPGTEIPLAALGVFAYATVVALSLLPLLFQADPVGVNNNERDQLNQVAVTAVTSSMAVFSLALMAILVFILHESCLYCFASAALSFTLASLAWWERNRLIAAAATTTTGTSPGSLVFDGIKTLPASAIGALTSIAAATLLVTSVNGIGLDGSALQTSNNTPPNSIQRQTKSALLASSSSTSTLMAVAAAAKSNAETKAQPTIDVLQSPPAITTSSSSAALRLAKDLQSLDATFYGAFWCGHCYEQKQAFGREAMAKIPYVECSKEGVNAQVALCKEKKVPGYPTWEIGGQLYPGEQSLDELQVIVEAKKAVIL